MRQPGDNWHSASALSVALTIGLSSICAVLLVITATAKIGKTPPQDSFASQLGKGIDSITALGNYPDTSVPLSGNATVTPDAAPTNTTSLTASTSTKVKGTFAGNPATGVLRVTDAHPAGTYSITVRSYNGPFLTGTKTFTLTVTTPSTCTPVSFAAPVTFAAPPDAFMQAV